MEEREKIIEKLKTYLDEKLGLTKEESFVILSIMAKDCLEEITEEDFDLDESLDDIDEDLDDEEQTDEEAAEDDNEFDELEPKEKTVIKKPKLEVKGAKEKSGEKDVLQ